MVKVSVIVPVYNGEEYLENTANCILSQSLRDIELVLVDDGSNDKCARLCDEIAESDSRVKVIHKRNGGISSARNVGIEQASGEYIAFVDQDDSVALSMYEELYAKAFEGYDVVISDFNLVYKDSTVLYKTFDVHENYSDTYKDMLLHGYGGNIWNMVIRRSLVVETGLSFPEHLRHCEDWYFSFRLFLNTCNVAKVNKPLYQYNLSNPSQVSNNLGTQFVLCCMANLDEIIDYMKGKAVYDLYKRELHWLILQTKTNFIFLPEMYGTFNSWHPEANTEVFSCPFLGNKMKIVMLMMRLRLYRLVSIVADRYSR